VPRFQEFKYYYLLDVMGMPEFNYAMMFIVSSITQILITLTFHFIFKKLSYRQGFAIGILMTSMTTIFDICFVMGIHRLFFINDYLFLIFTNLIEDLLSQRYTFICSGVVHTNIAP